MARLPVCRQLLSQGTHRRCCTGSRFSLRSETKKLLFSTQICALARHMCKPKNISPWLLELAKDRELPWWWKFVLPVSVWAIFYYGKIKIIFQESNIYEKPSSTQKGNALHCEPHLILEEMIYYTFPSFPLPVLYVHLCTHTSFPPKDRSEEINCNV